LGVPEEAAITQLSERHEVRVRGQNGTIAFVADSQDGRLVIRQDATITAKDVRVWIIVVMRSTDRRRL